jgi:hypothetical protein
MKRFILLTMFIVGCSSKPEVREEQQVDQWEKEERARTGQISDEIGPGYDDGTTLPRRN